MKYALKNAVILDGTKDMEPLRGQSVLVEGETVVIGARRKRTDGF